MSKLIAHFQLSHILSSSKSDCAFQLVQSYNSINLNFSKFIFTILCRKGKSTQSEDGEHHNILIYKNPNMQRFAQNLQKFDRIYLTGFMTYSTKVYSDGNEQRKGFIQPKNLVKLQRFDE